MYRIYVDGLLFPIAPPSIETQINNRNETVDTASGYEINKLKYPGLTDISMEFRLPNTLYPFAIYENDEFQNAQHYLDKLEELKRRGRQEGFDLVIVRSFDQEEVDDPSSLLPPTPTVARKGTLSRSDVKAGKKTTQFSRISMDGLTVSVSLEDYKVTEDAEEGFDWLVQCNFKHWQKWGTKTIRLEKSKGKKVKFSKGKKRKRKKKYKSKVKTKKGQTLWQICKAAYGHGDTWANVAIKNNKKALQKAAKKLGIKWGGVTTDWKSKKLPAGITITLPKVTYSPKKRKKVTKKQIEKHFGVVWKNLSKKQRDELKRAYRTGTRK